jgi:hypothetical protein
MRPIDTIEPFFISESAARSGDESNADPIAGNHGATGVFDERGWIDPQLVAETDVRAVAHHAMLTADDQINPFG